MSRRHKADKREILPDPKFGDLVLSKFINCVMTRGKKSVAERIVYGALEIIEKKAANQNFEGEIEAEGASKGMMVFHRALKRIKPKLEVRSAAASAVRPTRFRLKFVMTAALPSQSAGSSKAPTAVRKKQ
jgi:ribosomal protein S7